MIGVREAEGTAMGKTTFQEENRVKGRREPRLKHLVASWGSVVILIGMATITVRQLGLSSALLLAASGVVVVVGVVLVGGYVCVIEDWMADNAAASNERLAAEQVQLSNTLREAFTLANGRPQDIDSAAELAAQAVTSMVARIEAPEDPPHDPVRSLLHRHRVAAGA